jgi:phosphoglucomutase
MSSKNKPLETAIRKAVDAGQLLESTAQNISTLLCDAPSPFYEQAVGELAKRQEWAELNDRFYKTLAFGTGGLRGRTIGKIVTRAERGEAGQDERPQFPCVGTNAMNFFNVSRATQGLVAYLHEWRAQEKIKGKPKIVIACDSRYFSKEFTELAARTATENGCDACVFEGPRSTPELSFAVRHLRASAGIVITASHNPPHDNGYKVYFSDGAQVVEPHASGIIARVNSIQSEKSAASPEKRSGELITLGREVDEAYMNRLESLILNKELVRSVKALGVVFTPLYGTGSVIIKPMLKRLGFNFLVVEEQDRFDGNFPSVNSPNPENAAALRLGVELAEEEGADLVIATDPDCDRMGVAVRTANGKMELLTGNQIGSLLAYYRTKTLLELGVLNQENAARAVIIKTFVTTDLQRAIAEHYGLRCVETLTGFKYIGAKLGKYEKALPPKVQQKYRDLPEEETRRLRLEQSSYFVFGGEESYGYSGGDFVRDKDGNAGAIMFCEVAAYAKSRGLTVDALLDEIFSEFGYFHEFTGSLVFEGAEGAETIRRLLASYVTKPPVELLGAQIIQVKNFETDTYRDIEGDEIPKEKMLVFEFGDHTRIAVRASGTEPKIKYYLFAQRRPKGGKKFSASELSAIKREVSEHLARVWEWLREDAGTRAATPLPARQSG